MNTKTREQELLSLGFLRNEHQEVYFLSENDETWHVDFKAVSNYGEERWTKFMYNINNDRENVSHYLSRYEKYKLGYSAAEKKIKQKITDLKNKYKSNLQEELTTKVSKTESPDRINKLSIQLATIKEIENKL